MSSSSPSLSSFSRYSLPSADGALATGPRRAQGRWWGMASPIPFLSRGAGRGATGPLRAEARRTLRRSHGGAVGLGRREGGAGWGCALYPDPFPPLRRPSRSSEAASHGGAEVEERAPRVARAEERGEDGGVRDDIAAGQVVGPEEEARGSREVAGPEEAGAHGGVGARPRCPSSACRGRLGPPRRRGR